MAATWTAPVLLGLYDSHCPAPLLSQYESKIGGYPDFFPSCEAVPPPTCRSCDQPLLLLVQVYCPLEASPYHRLLHVFCCKQPTCWTKSESWCVLRSQLKDPSYTATGVDKQDPVTSPTGFSASDWCDDADDWDVEPEDKSAADEFHLTHTPSAAVETQPKNEKDSKLLEVQMNSLSLEQKDTPQNTTSNEHKIQDVVTSYHGDYYSPCYISVIEEPSETVLVTGKVKELLGRYQREENTDPIPAENNSMDRSCHRKKGKGTKSRSAASQSGGGESYEKTIAKHGDRVFQKFYKQMSRCPQQIMRYCWKGTPLLITDTPIVPLSSMKCKYCGASCVFELQLMPSLVYVLQQQNGSPSSNPPTIEFGTVLVYSCSDSCWPSDSTQGANPQVVPVREEYAIVQQDPDNSSMQEITKSCNQT